jgi:hypothetical protein
MTRISRRKFSTLVSAAVLARTARAQIADTGLITRAIPGTGELLPAVGLGMAYVYDRNDERSRRAAA